MLKHRGLSETCWRLIQWLYLLTLFTLAYICSSNANRFDLPRNIYFGTSTCFSASSAEFLYSLTLLDHFSKYFAPTVTNVKNIGMIFLTHHRKQYLRSVHFIIFRPTICLKIEFFRDSNEIA